jgi:hypothetical protein
MRQVMDIRFPPVAQVLGTGGDGETFIRAYGSWMGAGLLTFFSQWTGDSVQNVLRFKERLKLMIPATVQETKTATSQ